MSYEPDIVIYKPDLDKKNDEILSHQYGKFRKKPKTDAARYKQQAWDKLESVLMNQPFKIKGVPMIWVSVELSRQVADIHAKMQYFVDHINTEKIEHIKLLGDGKKGSIK